MGLVNPYSRNPDHALVPYPNGCAGHRLQQMTGLDPDEYVRLFDRRNMCGQDFELTLQLQRAAAERHLDSLFGRTVILLGESVRQAFSFHTSEPIKKVLLHAQVIDGVTWRAVPHPSGRNPFYNDPVCRTVVGMMLHDLAKGKAQ